MCQIAGKIRPEPACAEESNSYLSGTDYIVMDERSLQGAGALRALYMIRLCGSGKNLLRFEQETSVQRCSFF